LELLKSLQVIGGERTALSKWSSVTRITGPLPASGEFRLAMKTLEEGLRPKHLEVPLACRNYYACAFSNVAAVALTFFCLPQQGFINRGWIASRVDKQDSGMDTSSNFIGDPG
jgi:hypothetical protein